MHPELFAHLTKVEHDVKQLVGHGAAKSMGNWKKTLSSDGVIKFVQRLLRSPARFDSPRIEKLGGLSVERVVLDFVPHLFTEEDLEVARETLGRPSPKAQPAAPAPAKPVATPLTAEFDGRVDGCGCVALPGDIVQKLPAGTPVHIVVRWMEEDAKAAEAALAAHAAEEAAAVEAETAVAESAADAPPADAEASAEAAPAEEPVEAEDPAAPEADAAAGKRPAKKRSKSK